ncbi:acyl-CoA thioesterase [Candidatus Planktophila dulcis]|jgi:acyl-CoA thioester hydrolase|uniref:acyl-CoA thioesterase n=1 Tax=Candidatus Planktophila dulcis TaxID=1884914 RepID=UPI003CE6CEE7
MKFLSKQFVRWDDLDAMGHVNNAKFLTYAQEARFLWATEEFSGAMRETSLIEMVVARAEVDFIEPIYEGGRFVDVEITIGKIGNSSFNMLFTIGDQGKVFAKVMTVQVAVSTQTMKSRPLTDKEREFLTKYLETN